MRRVAGHLHTQAQQLQVLERRHPGLRLGGGHAQRGGGTFQPLPRAGGGHAGGQRQHARGLDEERTALQLQVDDVVAVDALRVDTAVPVQRRPVLQRVDGQLAQEAGRGCRLLHDQRRQRRRERRVAGDGPQVEVDAGGQQVLRRAMGDPLREARLPACHRAAAVGVAGHHAAGAQRVAAIGQRLVHRLSQRQPARQVGLGGIGQHEAVVLVGGHRLLATAFGAEGQPAGLAQVEPVRLGQQGDQPRGERVVELAHQLGDVARLHALREQLRSEAADVGGGLLQRGHVAGGAQRIADLSQRQPLQREQVALGDDARQPPLLRDRHVAHALARHQQRRVVCAARRVERVHGRAHHARDRGREVGAGQHHAGQQVVPRQDAAHHAGAITIAVHHQHRTDTARVHLLQRVAQRRVRRHGQRQAAQELRQRRFQRLLRQHLLGECGLRAALHLGQVGQRVSGRGVGRGVVEVHGGHAAPRRCAPA